MIYIFVTLLHNHTREISAPLGITIQHKFNILFVGAAVSFVLVTETLRRNAIIIPFVKGKHLLLVVGDASQQTGDVGPALVYCWATVVDDGPTANQRWANVSCLLVCYLSRDY